MDSTPERADITAAFRDLHRRSGPAPRKRTRFAPAKPAAPGQSVAAPTELPVTQPPSQVPSSSAPSSVPVQVSQSVATSSLSTPTAPSNGRPSPPTVNGSASNGVGQPARKSVIERIADAQAAADARPRPDPRFLPGQRALDSMSELASSVGVSLFSDGYTRHDSLLCHATGVSAPRAADILALPRLPYDAASRSFLRALELGVLPLDEDMPPEVARRYHDGCLVAEVFDCRGVDESALAARGAAWRQPGAFTRVLLRPDAASHAADVDMLTHGLDDEAAIEVEGRLLLAEHPTLDLDPAPRARAPPLWRPLVKRRGRRGPRPVGGVEPPPMSMSALLLIAGAAKSQVLSDLRVRNVRAPDSASAAAVGVASPKAVTPQSLGAMHAKLRQGIQSTKPVRGPNGSVEPPRNHGRLRTIRLILPDKATHARYRQLKALSAAGSGQLETHEQIVQAAFVNLNRAGRQVCIIELVARAGKGCDVALFRGVFGDRAKDVNKMSLGSLEAANSFMDHFKGIMEREGYVCIHDGDPQPSATAQAQAEARRRALAQTHAAAAAGGLSPAGSAQALAARNRQIAILQAQQAQQRKAGAPPQMARPPTSAQARMLQQGFDARQRQAYAAGVAQLQQARAGAGQAAMLQAQAALTAAAASKSAARYNQQLNALPRAGTAARAQAGAAPTPETGPIMSQLAQLQASPSKLMQRNRIAAAAARGSYPPANGAGIDASVVMQHQQQIIAARAAQQAAQAARPQGALGVPMGMQPAISPNLLNLDAMSGGSVQAPFKGGGEGSQDAGSRGGKR